MSAESGARVDRNASGVTPHSGVAVERLLVVGLGSIGQRHARVAHRVRPGIQVAAWRHRRTDDPLPAGVSGAVWSIDEAIAFKPHAAIVASPATHHLEAAHALALAGVHLLIEKPIAAESAGIDELIAVCERRGLTIMTGYNLRFLPSLNRFRALVLEGAVGDVLSVRAEAGQYLPSWRPDADYRNTVSARASLGGGVLLELSHEFDYLRWIFGDVTWVQAVVSRQSQLDIDVEDTAHVVLGFERKSTGAEVIASLSLDFVRQDTTRCCTVIGTRGTLRWNGISGVVDIFRSGAAAWEQVAAEPVERDATYVAEWQAFLAGIETGCPVPVHGRDGLAVLRIVEAVRRAAATSGTVRLESAHMSAGSQR